MAASREPLGWGIVGFGWVAQDYVAPAIAAASGRLAAVCDPDPAAQAAALRLGARATADVADLARDDAVEAVYVATPNHLHRAGVEAAAAAGKPVLCEKPMAATLGDADAMAAAVRRAGILYGTAFDQRHHPAHEAVRDAVAAGAVGRVTAIRIAYACWVGADWAEAGRENWRVDAGKAGGGAVMDLAPHGLDLVEFLLGEPVVALKALMQSRVQDYAVDDGGMLVGRTGSGVLASLHVAYNCPEGLPRRRLEILGSSGQITATDTMGQTAGGTVTLTEGRAGETCPLAFAADRSPFVAQLAAFTAAIRGGHAGPLSLERDLATMRLLDSAYRDASALPPHSGASRSGEPGTHDQAPQPSRGSRVRGSAAPRNEGRLAAPRADREVVS